MIELSLHEDRDQDRQLDSDEPSLAAAPLEAREGDSVWLENIGLLLPAKTETSMIVAIRIDSNRGLAGATIGWGPLPVGLRLALLIALALTRLPVGPRGSRRRPIARAFVFAALVVVSCGRTYPSDHSLA